jgi:hypothetical protein
MSTFELKNRDYVIKDPITKDNFLRVQVEEYTEEANIVTVKNMRNDIIVSGNYVDIKKVIDGLQDVYDLIVEQEEEKKRIREELARRKEEAVNGLSASDDREGGLSLFNRKKKVVQG